MIITIDGPGGAGKSTVAGALAKRLGFRFLNTGAMYRAVALAAARRHVDWQQPDALGRLAGEIDIHFDEDRVLLDGEDVSDEIHTAEIDSLTHRVAAVPEVRRRLVDLQRRAVGHDDVVTEGRDQGTVVFPQAEYKIFLTASPEVRARRRWREQVARGEDVTYQEVLEGLLLRDQRDANRDVGPLKPAADAVEFVTDGLQFDEVVDRLVAMVREKTRSNENHKA